MKRCAGRQLLGIYTVIAVFNGALVAALVALWCREWAVLIATCGVVAAVTLLVLCAWALTGAGAEDEE